MKRFHYAWVVLAVTFLTLLASAGVRAAPGVLIIPLEQEFHWSRATISLAISINLILYGLMGPFAGALMQRFGVRRVTLTAMSTLALAVALASRVTHPWQLIVLWGVIVGLATGMAAIVLGATVVNRWFVNRRGLALGILTASTATGQLVFLPMLASVVEHQGWRTAVLIVAAGAALCVPIIALLLRDRPEDIGIFALGADQSLGVAGTRANPARTALLALRDGAKSRDFWLLFGTFFICGASTNGLIATHLIPAAHDHGIPEVRAAGLLALMGAFDLIGTTGSGWLTDRWSSRGLLAWYYSLRGLSLLFLPFALAGTSMSLLVFAIWYGLDWIATVPPTVKLANDAFGTARGPIMFGWIAAGHQLGAGITAFAAGWVRTTFGDYQMAFWTSGGLCLLAAGLSLAVGRKRHDPAGLPSLGAAVPS